MKYSLITLIFVAIFAVSLTSNNSVESNDCDTYFPLTVGMKWTVKSYDKKRIETGRNTYELTSKKSENGGVAFMFGVVSINGSRIENPEESLGYYCKDNMLTIANLCDGRDSVVTEVFVDEDMREITYIDECQDLKIPSELNIGQKLKSVITKGTTLRKRLIGGKQEIISVSTTSITDRVVEKFEDITTSAGTYNCAKITSIVTAKTGELVLYKEHATKWYSDEVGFVKGERYKKNGKLIAGSELVDFSE